MQIAPLAYRIVLGHFLPGCLALFFLKYYFKDLDFLYQKLIWGDGLDASQIGILAIIALIVGNIVEVIRYGSIDIILNRLFYGRKSAEYSKHMKTDADIQFYLLVYDTSYAPYQFYSNSFLVILALIIQSVILNEIKISSPVFVLSVLSCVFLSIGAVRATYGASVRIKSRFSINEGGD